MQNALSAILCTAAFLLCVVCGSFIIGDDTRPTPDNLIYHYQGLIAGVLAIIAAGIGGWFVMRSAKFPEREKKRQLIEGWIRHCEDALIAIHGRDRLAVKYREVRNIFVDIEPLKFIDIDESLEKLAQEILDHYIEPNPVSDVAQLVLSEEKIRGFEALLRKIHKKYI